jgi:serine/threonine-protein kinase ULK/ATG1
MSKLTKRLKENLDTEISILKSLQHPHIVAMFSLVEKPAHMYLIMEYCQLSDLSQFMKKRTSLATYSETADIFRKYPNTENGGLHEVLARHFLKQIASALEYLRRRNLIHRDIKPQNLLLNPSPEYMSRQPPEAMPLTASEHSLIPTAGVASLPMLKIADFGFARHLPSTSMAETLCGSPLYMAPEILRYEKYDARADLWSVGTVLYEMVVGKPPFRAQNHVELLRRIEKTNDVITFDKSLVVGRDIKTAIRKLLKKSPIDRVSYEDFFQDPVITGEIPGLVGEDRPQARPAPDPEVSELSRRMAKQSTNAPTQDLSTTDSSAQQLATREVSAEQGSSRRPSFQDEQTPDVGRRRSSTTYAQTATAPRDIQRRTSQRERRPSIVAHATAPGRQELYMGPSSTGAGANTGTSAGQRLERRPSRASPLSGPPMVREQSLEVEKAQNERNAHRAGGEKVAQDIAFEKEYVVIEKRQVEVNAFADELDANAQRSAPNSHGAMVRRATTQGQPNSVTGAQPSSPSRGMQRMTGKVPHHRTGSFERRYVPSPQSATNMLTKALNAANVRLFGALGTSPPFGKGSASPPRGYSAYPTYPTAQGTLTLGDGADARAPLDEDTKIVRIVEEAGHRSDVVFGFAEVKYRQLLPATPSAQDGLGIQQLGNPDDGSGNEEDKDMTNNAIVGVAEEALVLYVKTLSILAKTIDLAGFWWSKQQSRTGDVASASPRSSPVPSSDTSKRMNNVVQWARSRFNECLEKSEIVGLRLVEAQKRLPADHTGNPNNYASGSTGSGGAAISTSREQIQLTTDVTAEKLMFERAVEMSRASALNELVGGDELADCELGYVTSIMLFEAVLESEDEPLMRKPSAKKDVPADGGVAGLEGEERATVVKRKFTLPSADY